MFRLRRSKPSWFNLWCQCHRLNQPKNFRRKNRVTAQPKINRRGWLATWLQKRRRARQSRSAQSFPAPSLVSLGTVVGDTTWRAVAPIAVDDWQFCTNDGAFDPEVKTFDQWVDGADSPDTAFVNVDAKTATVTVDFGWCAARYLVGTTWSSWTNVVPATVVAPPAIVLTSDGHGHLTWTYNFVPPSDPSQPGIPYDGINIYKSDDGVTWPSRSYDGWDLGAGNRDCSGDPGWFRICICDWDGNDVPPYSNAVYSDGL